jgi:hypothetical protein
MKYAIIPACLICLAMNLHAQETEKQLPPPPPPPKVKKTAKEAPTFTPPKIVKDEAASEKPKFTPPRIVKNKATAKKPTFTPPKIVKDKDDDFLGRNPDVSSININNNAATVTLKNKNQERFDLNNPGEKAAFIEKYGALPVAPPPPPPPPIERRVKIEKVKSVPPPPPPAPPAPPSKEKEVI